MQSSIERYSNEPSPDLWTQVNQLPPIEKEGKMDWLAEAAAAAVRALRSAYRKDQIPMRKIVLYMSMSVDGSSPSRTSE